MADDLVAVPGFEAASSRLPEDLVLIEDFISPEYEQQLLSCIDWGNDDGASFSGKLLTSTQITIFSLSIIYQNVTK